jgi:hypothetical protein
MNIAGECRLSPSRKMPMFDTRRIFGRIGLPTREPYRTPVIVRFVAGWVRLDSACHVRSLGTPPKARRTSQTTCGILTGVADISVRHRIFSRMPNCKRSSRRQCEGASVLKNKVSRRDHGNHSVSTRVRCLIVSRASGCLLMKLVKMDLALLKSMPANNNISTRSPPVLHFSTL